MEVNMIGLLLLGLVGLGTLSSISTDKAQHEYKQKLSSASVGKTIIRTGKDSKEVFTFKTHKDAIEHPQEITFNPDCALNTTQTALSLTGKKRPIEFFNGEKFVEVSDTELLTVTQDGAKTYVYLRFVEL